MKKFIDRYFLLICVLVLVLFFWITGLRLCAVKSGSMEPTIPTGSICVVSTRTAYEDIRVGDVVVYRRASDGLRIIHRVVEITDEGMVTKGDANRIDDGLSVTAENLYAKHIFHIPYLGRLSMAVQTPVGVAVVILIMAALLFFGFRSEKKPEAAAERTGTAGEEKKE